MKSTIGKSNQSNPDVAVKEATVNLSQPNLIIFIAPYENLARTAELLHENYPGIPSIGTLGTTLVNGNVSSIETIIVGFHDVVVSADIIEGLSLCPISHISSLQENIKSVSPDKGNTVCFEFCTSEEERLVTTLNAGLAPYEISLVGGTVFGQPEGAAALVALNGKLYEDACCYAIIKNKTGRIKVYKENIYENKNNVFHHATKVDPSTGGLIELNYRPAHEVYTEELGVQKVNIIGNVLVNPMGRVVGDDVFISSMREMTPDGTINNFKKINENDTICFLDLMDYEEVGKRTRERIKKDFRIPSFILSVDCIYRYLLFREKNYMSTHAANMASMGPHVGIIGGGEQYNNQHVNQTMVCVVFE